MLMAYGWVWFWCCSRDWFLLLVKEGWGPLLGTVLGWLHLLWNGREHRRGLAASVDKLGVSYLAEALGTPWRLGLFLGRGDGLDV